MNTSELLAGTLRSTGVGEIYGAPLDGLEVVVVSPGVAELLARAHERVHAERAAVHLGGGVLRLGSTRHEDVSSTRIEVETPAEIVELAEPLRSGGDLELRLSLDLGRPTDLIPPEPVVTDGWAEPSDETLQKVSEARSVAVLCGPGVVRAGAVWGLHELAAVGGLGVLNTWGAKGVFDWRSRHHWATVGLQRDDFVLGGLAGVDLIVATGIDPLESPAQRWALSPYVIVEPAALARLAELWPSERAAPQMPPLRDRLSRVTQAGWSDERVPMQPTRVTLAYSRVFGSHGIVASDPGTSGFWVARTFATTRLASAHVPAEAGSQGSAVACCLVARLRRPCVPALAVVDAPLHDDVKLMLEAASRLGVGVAVEVWDPEGERVGADVHSERLGLAAAGTDQRISSVATDPRQLEQIVEVAGPIVAWT